MASTVSIVIRARDNTRAGFRSLDTSLGGLQNRLRGSSGYMSDFERRIRQVAVGGLGGLRNGLQRTDRGMHGLLTRVDRLRSAGLDRLQRGFSAVSSAAMENAGTMGKVLGVVLLLAPAVGILASALAVGLGGAFIGLGAMALKGDKDVQAAFKNMKSGVSSAIKEAAQPLKPFLIDGIQILKEEALELKPALASAFKSAGPMIAPLVHGITGLAQQAMPGFNASLKQSRPAMQGFEIALKSIGKGLGEMLEEATSSDSLQEVWVVLGDQIRGLLRDVGGFTRSMNESETATATLVLVFKALGGVLNAVEVVVGGVDKVFGGLFDKLTAGATDVKKIADGVGGFGKATSEAKRPLEDLRKELEAVNKEIREAQEAADMDIPGPVGDKHREDLDGLLKKRDDLTKAIAKAEADAASATKSHAQSVQLLVDNMRKLNENSLSAFDTQTRFEEAIDKVSASIKENGRTLDVGTEKGRANRDALSELARATEAAAKAAQDNGSKWSTVNGIYDTGRKKLYEAAIAMGHSRAAARKLADQIRDTPSKTAHLKGNLDDLKRKLDEAKARLRKVPDSRRAQVKADIAKLQDAINRAKAELRSIPDETVTLRVNKYTTTYYASVAAGTARGGLATGGIVGAGHAAEGGPRSAMTLVGEQGPELVRLPFGSMVKSHADSRRMLAGGGDGGGGPTVLEIKSGGSRLDDLLVELLRGAIRRGGGSSNVQLYLGGRTG